MSEELAVRPSALPRLEYNKEEIELIKHHFAVGATDKELQLFIYISKKLGLNILTRQVHFVKRKRKNPATGVWEEVAAFQIGIDGYVQLAQEVRGSKGEVMLDGFNTEVIRDEKSTNPRQIVGAKATVYRKDFTHSVEVEVDFDEYAAKTKEGELTHMWKDKPKTMIEKCALALALRRTFPQTFAGTYVPEEVEATYETVAAEVRPQAAALPPVEESVVPPGTAPTPAEVAKVTGKPILRILKNIEQLQFFDDKGNTITAGPFKVEDVIYEKQIPDNIVKGWVERGLAKEIVPKGEERKVPAPPKEEKVGWEPIKVAGADIGGIRRTDTGCQMWFDKPLPIPADPRQDTMETFMLKELEKMQLKDKEAGKTFTWEIEKATDYDPEKDVEVKGYRAIDVIGVVDDERWKHCRNSARWTAEKLLEKAKEAQQT